MRPATGKVSIVDNPVFSSVVDIASLDAIDITTNFHLTEFKAQKRADDLMPTAPDSASSFDRLRQDHAVNDVDHSV